MSGIESATTMLDEMLSDLDALLSGSDQSVGERKILIVKLKVTFVVKLGQSRTVRMVLLEVQIVFFRLIGGVSAFFAHVHLGSTFFVRVIVRDSVHFQSVRFERATLRERFVAAVAFVGSHSCSSRGRGSNKRKKEKTSIQIVVRRREEANEGPGDETYRYECECDASGRTCR